VKVLTLLCCLFLAAPAAAQPQIQPAAVKVANSPNALAWPVTTRIQRLELGDQGVRVTFDRCASWPDVTPPGWTGPLRFTLWLFEDIGGEWFGSGIIQFWGCDQASGGAVHQDNQIARNWVYDNRWASMVGHQPAPGERIGFMVSAGNARGQDDHVVAERSDIVEVFMPSFASSFPPTPFAGVEGTSVPPPVATPPPVIVPPPSAPPPVVVPPAPPALDLSNVAAALAAIKDDVDASRAENQAFYKEARTTVGDVLMFITKYIVPSVAGLIAGHQLAK